MLFNLGLTRLAKAASLAALSFGVALSVNPNEKASAQSVFIEGVGSSSFTIPLLLENWLDPVGGFANYAIAGSGEGRSEFNTATGRDALGLINGNPNAFFFSYDFASSTLIPLGADTGTTAIDADGNGSAETPIVNVNPVNVQIAFVVNVDFNNDGIQDFPVELNLDNFCGVLAGTITNWNQIGGTNAVIRRVFRSDASGLSQAVGAAPTTALSGGIFNRVCASNGTALDPGEQPFVLTNAEGFVDTTGINFDANDILTPQDQGVVAAVANTVGTIGYVTAAFAVDAGFVNVSDYATLLATLLDINGDGVVGSNDLNGDGDTLDLGEQGEGETIDAFVLGTFPNYFGFYEDYTSATAQDGAANLCLYLTRGLDFDGNGSIELLESGREFATALGYAEPTQSNLDPNCGKLFPGFGGFDLNGDGDFIDAGELLPSNGSTIPAL
jgi:hypothetical protein